MTSHLGLSRGEGEDFTPCGPRPTLGREEPPDKGGTTQVGNRAAADQMNITAALLQAEADPDNGLGVEVAEVVEQVKRAAAQAVGLSVDEFNQIQTLDRPQLG